MTTPPPPPPPPPQEPWIPSSPPAASAAPPAEERRSRRAIWILLSALIVLGAAVTIAALLKGDDTATTPTTTPGSTPVTSQTGGAGTTPTVVDGIDPSIGWSQTEPSLFAAPGDQQMNDVAVFNDQLIAAGSTVTYTPPQTTLPLTAGADTITLSEWELSITAVDGDAAELIAAQDPGNTPAPQGVRYIMVTLDVTNLSTQGTRNVWAELDASLTSPDGYPLARQSWCGRLPDALRSGPFDAGATHHGTICFAVLEAQMAPTMNLAITPAGTDSGETDGAIWISSDGSDWTSVADPDLAGPGRQTITHLAVHSDSVYAAGRDHQDDDDIALWRSADGAAWERIEAPELGGPGDQALTDLTEADGRLLAAGTSAVPVAAGEATGEWDDDLKQYWIDRPDTTRGVLWASDDGITWRTIDPAPAGTRFRQIDQIAPFQGLISVIGRDIDSTLMVATSSDLETWQLADLPTADTSRWAFATTGEAGGRLHALGTGLMSTGDGITWTLDGRRFAADVTATPQGLLAVGRVGGISVLGPLNVDERKPSLTVLTGEGTWSQVDVPDLIPEGTSGEMTGVIAWGGRYFAVGSVATGATRDAAVWTGGAPQGSATAVLIGLETTPPDAAAIPPPEPAADIVRFDGDGWTVIHRGDDLGEAELLADAPTLSVLHIAVEPTGALWAATPGAGVYRLTNGIWEHFGRAGGLPSDQVTALQIAGDGTPWVGTVAGPAYFDGTVWVAPDLPDALTIPQVSAIAVQPEAVWVATLSGVARWDGNDWTSFTMAEGLPSNVVMDVLAAHNGVWAVTPAGLAHWNQERWRAFTDAPYRPYFAASPYASPLDRAIYFSPHWGDSDEYRTDLLRMAPNGNTRVMMNEYSYKAMTMSPDGTLYVGTELYGLFLIGSGVERVGTIAGADLQRIGELWTAPDGTVWMDSTTGLFEIRAPGDAVLHTEVPGLGYPLTGGERSFSDGAVVDLTFGTDGSVWVLAREQLPEWDADAGN